MDVSRPDPSSWPWRILPAEVCEKLFDMGFRAPMSVVQASNLDLSEGGLSGPEIQSVREAFLGESPSGGVLCRAPDGNGGVLVYGGVSRQGGRPPSKLRARMRELLELGLDEVENRFVLWGQPAHEVRAFLEELDEKGQLVDWIMQRPALKLTNDELRRLVDTMGRYGIGAQAVVIGDEQAGKGARGYIAFPVMAPVGADLSGMLTLERSKLTSGNGEGPEDL